MNVWDEQYKTGKGLRWWPNEELIRFLGKTYPFSNDKVGVGRALDIGCGTGCNTWALCETGFSVDALDISLDALVCAQQHLSSKPRVDQVFLHRASLPTIPFCGETFDLVIDCQTIQHLDNPQHVLAYREILRVLKPGGRFWSMHFKDGDSEKVYTGKYPELVARRWTDMIDLFPKSLRTSNIELVSRSHDNCRNSIFWFCFDLIKS